MNGQAQSVESEAPFQSERWDQAFHTVSEHFESDPEKSLFFYFWMFLMHFFRSMNSRAFGNL